MTRAKKPITYHKSHTFTDNKGDKHSFITQLYQVGVYGILDGNSGMQGNFTPSQIKRMENNLQKAKDKGEIKSFELGILITVTDESGLWKEVN